MLIISEIYVSGFFYVVCFSKMRLSIILPRKNFDRKRKVCHRKPKKYKWIKYCNHLLRHMVDNVYYTVSMQTRKKTFRLPITLLINNRKIWSGDVCVGACFCNSWYWHGKKIFSFSALNVRKQCVRQKFWVIIYFHGIWCVWGTHEHNIPFDFPYIICFLY